MILDNFLYLGTRRRVRRRVRDRMMAVKKENLKEKLIKNQKNIKNLQEKEDNCLICFHKIVFNYENKYLVTLLL